MGVKQVLPVTPQKAFCGAYYLTEGCKITKFTGENAVSLNEGRDFGYRFGENAKSDTVKEKFR